MITLTAARTISIERIAGLEPAFRSRVRRWLDMMFDGGNPVLITEGLRTIARQQEIFDSGVRPCATPGKSYHNYGLAVDYVCLRPAAKALGMFEADWTNEAAYGHGAKIAGQFRMVPISTESGHLQDARYADWREAKLSRESV